MPSPPASWNALAELVGIGLLVFIVGLWTG